MSDDGQRQNAVTIMNTLPRHGQGVYDVVRLAYGVPLHEECAGCINTSDVMEQLQRFPEGQFVAVYHDGDKEQVVGMASTMRTSYPP